MSVAVYPGKFDPVTNGHMDIVQRASSIFSRVVVGVLHSSSTTFTTDERVALFEEAIRKSNYSNVDVGVITGLTVDFAKQQGATVLVRGIRAVTDFEYEFDMALMNKKMVPDIESVYLMTSLEHLFVSASRIREITGLGRDPSEFVPAHVARALFTKLAKR